MSYKGTTWKKGREKKEDKIPKWALDLIELLNMEINLLRTENDKLKSQIKTK